MTALPWLRDAGPESFGVYGDGIAIGFGALAVLGLVAVWLIGRRRR